jgi:hypothetical protein
LLSQAIDQAVAERGARVDAPAAQRQIEGPSAADRPDEAHGAADVGHHSQPRFGQREEGVAGGHAEITGQSDLEASSGAGPIDRRDHWAGDGGQRGDDRLELEDQRQERRLILAHDRRHEPGDQGVVGLQIHTRREVPTRAGEDHHPRRVGGERLGDLRQLGPQRSMKRVPPLRTLDGEDGEPALALDRDELHGGIRADAGRAGYASWPVIGG